jgi:SpoVK/Ycf46/Vps4 family AAA+-type ATPase
VAAGGGLTFMFVEADEPPRLPSLETVKALKIHLDTPKAAVRSRVWQQALRQRGLSCSDELISPIAAIYPFNAGRIHACAREAELHQQHLDQAALAQICRGQTHHHLERLAQPLPSRPGWDDIVLPPDELRRLKEIASAVRNRDRVMEEWGFGRKVSAGPGVNAIFFGPSGTGKTMAASILAGELGLAIYRVDLSRVVSKYIGETERNLEALFDEARRSFALLFFDEAEALFGKRSEVKDAHDRYANIEVAYLLQRMEQFEGIAILATNLRTHMDTAFLRRLQFAVEFPLPTVADRLRIWRQVWPASALLGDDLDLEFMATHLELAGGHIRNVALTAAYLASEEPSSISMKHLVAATRRELQKLGRSCVPDQFGRYASLFEAS